MVTHKVSQLKLRPVGVAIHPAETLRRRNEIAQKRLHGAIEAGLLRPDALPCPQPPAEPVFADENGNHFIATTTKHGTTFRPYRPTVEVDPKAGNLADGGFLPLSAVGNPAPDDDANRVSKEEFEKVVDALKSASEETSSHVPADIEQVPRSGRDAPVPNGESGARKRTPEEHESMMADIAKSMGMTIGKEAARSLLMRILAGNMQAGGGLSLSGIGGLLLNQSVGFGLSQLHQYLMNSVWEVDDSSSAEEQLAHYFASKYGQDLLKEMFFNPTPVSDFINKTYAMLTPPPSGAVLAAAREDDKDTGDNCIPNGSATVTIEKHNAATFGHSLVPSQEMIVGGSSTVLIEKSPAARVTDLITDGNHIKSGAATVFIGDAKPEAVPVWPAGQNTGPFGAVMDIFGKIWNLPNTAVGLAWGTLSTAVQGVGSLFGYASPYVTFGHNAIQFHNVIGMPSAITLGNVILYGGGQYDPNQGYLDNSQENAPQIGPDGIPLPSTVGDHEEQHTYQGQEQGILYLPSNAVDLGDGLITDGNDHGPHNEHERGPQKPKPTPSV